MKFIRLYKDIEEANQQGTQGLYSPHIDRVRLNGGGGTVNFKKVNAPTFTAEFDNNGYMINATPIMHNVGDIVYWDGSKLAYTPYTSWNNSLGTALGVCFIPTSHAAVWGDGKARFLSVKGVYGGQPFNYEVAYAWCLETRDNPLTKYDRVSLWDNTIGGSVGSNGFGYISSDKSEFSGATNVIDTVTKYYHNTPNYAIPSPYAADGSFYADYIRTIEGHNNALSDFNGKENTRILSLSGDTYRAANQCNLFSTSGISAGEWYLPACGELGYIMPRFNVINSALTACNGVLLDNAGMWSSTYSVQNYSAYSLYRVYGSITLSVPNGTLRVRPVISLP